MSPEFFSNKVYPPLGWRGCSLVGSDGSPSKKYEDKYALVKKKFDQLSDDDRGRYLALADTETNGEMTGAMLDRLYADKKLTMQRGEIYTHIETADGTIKSPQGIFGTNCVPRGDFNEQIVCPVISRFNHSCRPNAIYMWREDQNAEVVLATRDISIGEEICVSYFDSRMMTQEQRQWRTCKG